MAITYVYNDDGSQPMSNVRLGHVKEDLEEWIDWVLATPVEAYVGCTAHPEICYHNTKAGERFGAREGVKFAGPSLWLRFKAQEELISQGTDQLRVLAERAHSRGKLFLACIRMSDAHHRWIGNTKPHEHPLFPQFTLDHPEYRIKKPDGTLDVTLDYSFEEVRAHRLAILKEIVRDYPVDGLELDFMRFCSHFPRPASPEQTEIMNDFMRSIRQMMDKETEKKKHPRRPILGVRVPPTMAECAPIGLDPKKWIQEKLIDYLTPANFLWADFNIALDDYLRVSKNTDCKVLFSIQPWVAVAWDKETRLYRQAFTMELPEFKALAANGFAAGADGLHCFNLCCEFPGRKDEMCEVLTAIAKPETIYTGLRHYQYFPSDSGETVTGANHRQTLRFSKLNEPQAFHFQMADGERKDQISTRLAWRIYNAAPTDQWQFRLNGQLVAMDKVQTEARYTGHPIRVGARLLPHVYFEMCFESTSLLSFKNVLEITPVHIEDAVEEERSMEVLEVWVGNRSTRGNRLS